MTMLKKTLLTATALASLACASGANAATLISAAVTGCCAGTVWDTTANSYYTLFISPNQGFQQGTVLNSNDEPISYDTLTGPNDFLTAGDGWVPGTTVNSDPLYNLTLTFAGGGTLTGSYDWILNQFTPTSGPLAVGNETLALTQFSWVRNQGNPVSQFINTPGGDPFDYAGSFGVSSRTTPGVPEPSTWAMLLIGFGGIGFSMRRRKSASRSQRVRIAYS
jgi:hypothetical protein